MAEEIFFEREIKATMADMTFGSSYATRRNAYVKVTSVRMIVKDRVRGEETYALSGITSVKGMKVMGSKAKTLLLLMLGLIVMMFIGGGWAYLYIPLIIIGLGIIIKKFFTEYVVVFSTASGNVDAFARRDPHIINDIVKAVNDAIIHRG